jgi:DNA-binding CsgD family transcriptional regulator
LVESHSTTLNEAIPDIWDWPTIDLVATERDRVRCRERLERLSKSNADGESLQREAIAELRRVVGFDRWCWPLADPETLLPGSGLAEHDYGPGLPLALEMEYSGADFAAKDVLARRPNPAGSMNVETGGDLVRSARWEHVMRPVGIGDVAAVACRDAFGCWGWIEAYRDISDRRFDEADLELLAQVGPSLGSALRRRAADIGAGAATDLRPPGVLIVDRALNLVSQTASARGWIDLLPAAGVFAAWGMLPAVIYPAATLARAGASGRAHALLRSDDGGGVLIDAAVLEGNSDEGIAVTLRAATPSELFDAACRAHGLSRREREVVALLVPGLDTRAMAQRLSISPHTVQDHLKSVFTKLHVHSRRELLARINGSSNSAQRS